MRIEKRYRVLYEPVDRAEDALNTIEDGWAPLVWSIDLQSAPPRIVAVFYKLPPQQVAFPPNLRLHN